MAGTQILHKIQQKVCIFCSLLEFFRTLKLLFYSIVWRAVRIDSSTCRFYKIVVM